MFSKLKEAFSKNGLHTLAIRKISKKSVFIWVAISLVLSALAIFSIWSNAATYVPVYRYFNSTTGDHYYPLTKKDYAGYTFEGIAFYAASTKVSKSIPIYSFYNQTTGDHRYEKKTTAIPGYAYEGIAFYAYSSKPAGGIPIYRYWDPTISDNLYERTRTEYEGYTYMGIAFYAISGNEMLPLSTTSSPAPTVVTEVANFVANTPVIRYKNNTTGRHFYTASATEGAGLTGYTKEGPAFYAYMSPVSGTVPVYRSLNPRNGDHIYSTSATEGPNAGFTNEGVAFYTYNAPAPGIIPVVRFYSGSAGDHFFTIAPDVETLSGYVREGTAFHAMAASNTATAPSAPIVQNPAQVPVYRYFSSKAGDHLYTTTQSTYSSYIDEGIAFYAYASQATGTVPVVRFWNGTIGNHFYTIYPDRENLPGYVREGTAFYANATQVTGTMAIYRHWSPTLTDHFYTVSAELFPGYTKEGPAFYATPATGSSSEVAAAPVNSNQATADSILQTYINKCPTLLEGATVSFGDTTSPNYLAISRYTLKEIIIRANYNPVTDTSLSYIIKHEVWHILDFAINQKIDWGENIPPAASAWPACML